MARSLGKLTYYGIPLLLALSAVVLAAFYHDWQHWAALKTGSYNTPGTPPGYNYWSGFGSVFPWEVGFVVGIWTGVVQRSRRSNCHVHRCWRAGDYPVGSYRVCKKHHFEVQGAHPTVEHLQEHYQSVNGVNDGGPGSDPGGDSGAGSCQCVPGPIDVS